MGPCSIHDVKAAKEYAGKLKREKERLAGELLVVMRVYFEKPRTTVGWKGLINDPDLDGSFRINEGPAHRARSCCSTSTTWACRSACEFLDMITPQYIADLVAWGAIGARTTESRSTASSPRDCRAPSASRTAPTATSGSRSTRSARRSAPHHFLSVTKGGHTRDRLHRRQRGLPHHPARRREAQLRRGERGRRRPEPGRGRGARRGS